MEVEKNFGLTPRDFELMVTELKNTNYDLFKRVFLRHFKACITYLQTHNKATYDDAYDATMDTLIQFRRLLVEGKLQYGNLRYLFTKIATQVYLRNLKKFQSQEMLESDFDLIDEIPVNIEEKKAMLNLIWAKLGPNCQELFKLHYYGNLKLKEIAALKGKTAATIRKQKERCLEKTRTILQKNNIYNEQ